MRLRWLLVAHRYCGWEPEVSWLREIGPCRGLAIDIGANCGLYSLALSRLYPRVAAFEPNPEISQPLRDASLGNVDLENIGLSSREGSSTLFVPVTSGQVLPGWGSLDKNNCPNADSLHAVDVQLRTIDQLGLSDVGFIKIDVEGHELEVIRGGESTIRRDLPHLLVEFRTENVEEGRTILHAWGYREVSLQDFGGPPGSPENHIFLPGL